jgi:outer membrane receptor protein involved in Fe transport
MRNLLIVTSLAFVVVGCATFGKSDASNSPGKAPTSDGGAADQLTASLPSDVLYFINGRAATRADVQALRTEAIESIEIIKGKSAVFLYGPEAGAGAILVTLKPTR